MSVKGGGGTPQIRNLFFGENFVRKGGGGTPLTDKIRKVVFEVFPNGRLRKSRQKNNTCRTHSLRTV